MSHVTTGALPPPPTRRDDVVDDHHGTLVADPYRWLEDADDPEVRAWVGAQNERTERWLARERMRPALRRRLTELWDHPRAGTPWRRGSRWFQLRNTGVQAQDVLWVAPAPDAEGDILLDPNQLSADGTVSLSGLAVTRDGALLAWATSDAGSDWMTWRVRDVASGRDTGDVVTWSKFSSAAWLPDSSGFVYARYDAPAPGAAHEARNLDMRLHLHRLGTPQDDDPVLLVRPDQPEWGFDGAVTDDGRWLVVTVWHGTHPENRVHLARIQEDGDGRCAVGPIEPWLDAADAQYGVLGNDGDTFYVRTTAGAPNGRVVAIDRAAPEPASWREVVPEGPDALEQVRLVGGVFVCLQLHHAAHRIRLVGTDGTPLGEVPLPPASSVTGLTGRRDDDGVCLALTGFTAPTSLHRVPLPPPPNAAPPLDLLRPPALNVDPSGFVAEQVVATSADGTDVRMFLVRRADVAPDGRRPVWLYGYGGFDIAVTPSFSVPWLVWLELGGVLGVMTLRGGGEYGQRWYDDGRLANKQHTFDDAIACAEWLVEHGWTCPERLALHGRSNGGLLVGACMTQRPDLFGACVPEVGVLDMLRFHRFTIGWGWASDYGTADDEDALRWLLAWSPLHNVRPGVRYPATLVTTGDHDDRVVPAHSYKFAAELQAAQPDDPPILLRVDTSAGHGAGKPTAKLIDERADVLAFLVRALGVETDD